MLLSAVIGQQIPQAKLENGGWLAPPSGVIGRSAISYGCVRLHDRQCKLIYFELLLITENLNSCTRSGLRQILVIKTG